MDKVEANLIIQSIAKECNLHEECKECNFCLAAIDDEAESCIFDEIIMPKNLKNYQL